MAGIEISPGKPGWLVVKFEHNQAIVAAIKQLAGHHWNPEAKFWAVADTPENRVRLTELAANPPKAVVEYLPVAPKRIAYDLCKPRLARIPGKPLTTNPPHPLIKLGHESIQTTERHTHVTQRGMGQVKSPLDGFNL